MSEKSAQWSALEGGNLRQDAYLHWALKTQFRDGQPQRSAAGLAWVWVLLQIKDSTVHGFVRQTLALAAWIRVPAHYASQPAWLEESSYCTACVSMDFLHWLAADDEAAPSARDAALLKGLGALIERFEIGFAAETPPVPFDAAQQPTTVSADHPSGPVRVVVGVIDDGLAFANRRFCTLDSARQRHTRLLSLWDQGAALHASAGAWGSGRVHLRADLDGYFLVGGRGAAFEEEKVYQQAGYKEVRHRVTHGTHVMDLACGADALQGAEPAAHIVAVQLPPVAVADTSCASMTPFFLDAMHHVLAQADAATAADNRLCPVVINLSMGNIAGPHDGSSMLESAVDELIALRRRALGEGESDADADASAMQVVLPEGNSLQSRTHAWAAMAPATEFALDWVLQPDDGTSSFLELWMQPRLDIKSESDRVVFEVSLQPPGDLPACVLRLDTASVNRSVVSALSDSAGRTLATLGLHALPANGSLPMALLTVAPSACYGPWDYQAPSGRWCVTVRNLGQAAWCNAYVQRDDVAFGRRGRGRQGVLEDGRYLRYDSRGAPELLDSANTFVRRSGTMNGLATGNLVRVIGGLERQADGTLKAALKYSAVDIPTRHLSKQLKRRLALTEDSPLLHGVLAAGSRSGGLVALSGTSMAAPQWSRVLAQRFLTDKSATRAPTPKVKDANGIARPMLPVAPELNRRSRLRRGG